MQTISATADFYKKATAVARHYGFVSFDELRLARPKTNQQNRIQTPPTAELKKMDPFGGTLSSLLSKALEKNIIPTKEPVLIYDATPSSSRVRFILSLIGARGSIAEAIVLKAAYAILEDNNIKNVVVRLNSIGDRDSSAKFSKDLSLHLRRQLTDLPEEVREAFKNDPFLALAILANTRHPLAYELPRSVEYLTGGSRKHLREIIEFLEIAGIAYELDNLVVGHRDCYSQSLFEIHPNETGVTEPFARGGRLDEFTKRFARTAVPTVSIVLSIPTTTKDRSRSLAPAQAARKPMLYFIHVGFEAKLRSLQVMEVFRKAHIPFYQCLSQDKLTEQLAYAERAAAPYIVIMGHKEALDNQVIVRNTSTRAQQTIPIDTLPHFFKHAPKR